MATILYSLAGEGRGHAARAKAIVDQLRQRHRVRLYTSHDAYSFLKPAYAGTGVEVVEIPGLVFHYSNHRLDFPRTLREAAGYLRRMPSLVDRLARELKHHRADLVVTDFEPALPRAAKKRGVPFVSLDHQHFLVACDLSRLPWRLRWYASYMGMVISRYHHGPARTLVSSFFKAPLRPMYRHVVQIGGVFRNEVLRAKTTVGGHLLAYLRKGASSRPLRVLKSAGRRVLVYGLGERTREGNLEFRPIDQAAFLDDMASCDAIVSAAGNQLLGEATFLGKPVLAIPEAEHHEQLINAHFLRDSGVGDFVELDDLTVDALKSFLDERERFREPAGRPGIVGNDLAITEIEAALAAS